MIPPCTEQTTGVEVVVAQVPIPDTTLIAELYLLDTSGSDLYKEALPQYWSGVYFAMLVFDITSPESFDSCRQWNDELKKNRWGEAGHLRMWRPFDVCRGTGPGFGA